MDMNHDVAALRDRTTTGSIRRQQQQQAQIVVDIEEPQEEKKKRQKRKRRRRQHRHRRPLWNFFDNVVPLWDNYFSSSPFSSIRLIAIFIAILFFLQYYVFHSSSSAASSLPFFATTTIKTTLNNNHNKALLTLSSCPPFGSCPTYPLNYNDASVQSYITNIQNFINTNKLYGVYNDGINVVSMTRETNSGHENQDRAVVIQPFLSSGNEDDNTFLAAIFDGHGDYGHVVAEYAQKKLPNVLYQKLNSIFHKNNNGLNYEEDQIKNALIATFIEIDNTAPADAAMESGCTASLILKLNQTIYVANTGDSRSFIATIIMDNDDNHDENNIHIPYITRRDKANLPDEKSRIEQMGGRIHIPPPPKPPSLSRVVAYSQHKKENIALAMSRSLGDAMWTKIGVIPDPIVDVLHVDDLLIPNNKRDHHSKKIQLLAVVGSDGIFDSRTKEFVSKHIAQSLFFRGDHPLVMSNELIRLASPAKEKWYRDDMTFAAVKFRL